MMSVLMSSKESVNGSDMTVVTRGSYCESAIVDVDFDSDSSVSSWISLKKTSSSCDFSFWSCSAGNVGGFVQLS